MLSHANPEQLGFPQTLASKVLKVNRHTFHNPSKTVSRQFPAMISDEEANTYVEDHCSNFKANSRAIDAPFSFALHLAIA